MMTLIVCAVFLFAACAVNPDGEPATLPGNTTADSLGTFELTLSGQSTRATQTVITKEEADNFLVTIYKGSDLIRSATRLKDLNSSLPAGYGYRVMAENCTTTEAVTVNDGWGQRRFAGFSASFVIKAGQTTAVNVGCSVANSAVEVVFDETIAEYFTTSYDVTITDGDRIIVFDATTAGKKVDGVVTPGRTAYFNLDENGEHPLTYTIHAVGPKEITKTGTLELSQAKIESLTLGYERSNFDLVVTLDEEEMIVDDILSITDDDIHVEDGTTEFLATTSAYTPDATAIETRAVLNTDDNTVSFADGDQVAVYDFSTEKHAFTANVGSDGRIKFSGKVTPKSQSFAAVYPYDAAASSASSVAVLAATLPATQYAVASTLDPALCFSVAKGQRNIDGSPAQVTFYNVPQLLRFTVPTYAEDKIKSITLTATTAIAGKLDINYSGNTPATTIASSESKTITILPPRRINAFEAGTYYIAAAPVQMNGFTLTYTCDGKTYTQTSTTTFGGQSGLIFELGSIDLINTPSVSVGHVYDGGVLQGTRVTFTGAPIEGRPWSATVKNASGTVVRTVSGTGDLSSNQSDANWPYLPKGNYTVTYTYTTSNGATRSADLALAITESPQFSVSFNALTSYSYYIGDGTTKNITQANACANNVIYAPTLTVSGISTAILNNSRYTFTTVQTGFSTTLKSRGDGKFVFNDVTVTDWKAYTLNASLTFDGVTKTAAAKTVQITGIPYTAAPPSRSGSYPWSEVKGGGKIDWNSGNVALGEGGTSTADPTVKSPEFYLPAAINVTASASGTLHTRQVAIYYRATLTMYVGNSNVWEQTSPQKSTTPANINPVINTTFSGSSNYLQFSTDTRTALSGYARITTVSVNYR